MNEKLYYFEEYKIINSLFSGNSIISRFHPSNSNNIFYVYEINKKITGNDLLTLIRVSNHKNLTVIVDMADNKITTNLVMYLRLNKNLIENTSDQTPNDILNFFNTQSYFQLRFNSSNLDSLAKDHGYNNSFEYVNNAISVANLKMKDLTIQHHIKKWSRKLDAHNAPINKLYHGRPTTDYVIQKIKEAIEDQETIKVTLLKNKE